MSSTKDAGFVAWKFSHLYVYTSTEWLADSKKKYKSVFEQSECAHIYTEFAFYNKLFDENETWKVKVQLICHEVDGKQTKIREVCNINVEREVKSEENMVYIREGWGNPTAGSFWKKGRYQWEAFLDGQMVGSQKFFIENAGPVRAGFNPYLSISSAKLFEGLNTLPPAKSRTYYTHFDNKETRYIWAELTVNNLLSHEDWYCEMVFNFYNDARQLKGKTTELVRVRKGQKQLTICSGWGSDKKGTWGLDNYTIEIVFMENLQVIIPVEVGPTFVKGEAQAMLPGQGSPLAGVEVAAEKDLEELMADLDSLIGLESIKKKIKEYTQYLNFLKLRQEKGFDDPQKLSLHAVFTGNPGTGKTTVAKKLGSIYQKLGLLTKGHVHEVGRAELVGEFIGQTAPKVKDAIKQARGGILFIDEAYALARSGEDSKDYGKEVIEILLKEMSDGPGDISILAAGYPKEMSIFLESNPGMKSRFNMYYDFPDYLPQELMEIATYSADQRKVKFTDETKELLYEKLVEAYRTRDRTFGNARYVNSLIDESKMNMGLRVMQVEDPTQLTEEDLSIIHLQDLQKVFGIHKKRLADIPIDTHLLQSAMEELNGMIGMENVKQEIYEVAKLVKFYREIGKDVLNTFSLHSVFTGNPGTGKTTVARILAKIFKALGILEKGHIVEVSRQKLVGGFLGQTAIKTAERIDQSIGGVLFIDEAYALTGGQDNYGKEAVETILKRMEDQRGQFIVIAAGYPDNMEKFLESNPGLKSRFDKAFHFEDYNPEQLFAICEAMLKHENIRPDEASAAHLKAYFNLIYEYKDKFFGNARTVRKVVEEAVRNQHLRLASLDSDLRTPEVLATLALADVDEYKLDRDTIVNSSQNRIGFKKGEN